MAEPRNLANAIVIIGSIYFMQSGFSWWLAILIGFGLITWGYWRQTDDQKTLIKLGIRQTEANIQNLNAATAIAIANTKLIARQLR